MSDLEQTAIERLKAASDMSLRLFEKPLVITYSGGQDSDVLLHLAQVSGIGAANDVTIGIFSTQEKRYHARRYQGDYEISALVGNVTRQEARLD